MWNEDAEDLYSTTNQQIQMIPTLKHLYLYRTFKSMLDLISAQFEQWKNRGSSKVSWKKKKEPICTPCTWICKRILSLEYNKQRYTTEAVEQLLAKHNRGLKLALMQDRLDGLGRYGHHQNASFVISFSKERSRLQIRGHGLQLHGARITNPRARFTN